MTTGRITVHRQGGPSFDLLRRYRILIDGVAVGKLRRGNSLTIVHAGGEATIEARIDWCSARPLQVLVKPGEETLVEVVNAKGMVGALTMNETLDAGNYLTLNLIAGQIVQKGAWG